MCIALTCADTVDKVMYVASQYTTVGPTKQHLHLFRQMMNNIVTYGITRYKCTRDLNVVTPDTFVVYADLPLADIQQVFSEMLAKTTCTENHELTGVKSQETKILQEDLQLGPSRSTFHTARICSSDLGGILVKLLYLTHIYSHLFKHICHAVDWSIQMIVYSLFQGLRTSGAIVQSLVLAFSELPSDFSRTAHLT